MVWRVEVEGGALDDEDLLLSQQVQHETFVVDDVEAFPIQLRKGVQRAARLNAADAFDLIQHGVGDATLFVQTSARHDELVDALIAAEGGLDGMLRRHVRAQTHGSEDVQPL